jgi:peptidase E
MVNILLNTPAIHERWCRRKISKYIRHGKKVLIVPFSFHEDYIGDNADWLAHYGYGQDLYCEVVHPLLELGVREEDIALVNYYSDTPKSFGNLIRMADVIYFTGGWPDKMMARLWEFGAISQLSSFPGVVMGYSAGAMIQFDTFHMTPEEEDQEFQYCDGLDLLSGFDIEVHYTGSDVQEECLHRAIQETGRAVFALEDHGGLIVDGNKFITLGHVHFIPAAGLI